MNVSKSEGIIRSSPLGYEWPGAYFVDDAELALVADASSRTGRKIAIHKS